MQGEGLSPSAIEPGEYERAEAAAHFIFSRTKLRRMSFDFLNDGQHHVFASTIGNAAVRMITRMV